MIPSNQHALCRGFMLTKSLEFDVLVCALGPSLPGAVARRVFMLCAWRMKETHRCFGFQRAPFVDSHKSQSDLFFLHNFTVHCRALQALKPYPMF